jgi:hypothetical protein
MVFASAALKALFKKPESFWKESIATAKITAKKMCFILIILKWLAKILPK